MLEAKLIIEIPGLAEALNNLATALSGAKNITYSMAAPKRDDVPVNAAATTAAPSIPVQSTAPAIPASAVPASAVPVQQSAPAAPVAPAPVSFPAPSVPLAEPPKYTVDQIMAAGASLMDAGKVNDLLNLLHSFGVQAVMDLKPEQLGAFATEMRKLGAKL